MGNKNFTDYERDKKMNIVFVVLHYKLYSVTKECIEYLLKQDYKDIHIVIVDNCSNNGSLEQLKNEYISDKIYFVSIEHNLGYAKANDLGYQIAKHKFNADFIAIINNDLFIEDITFCNKLLDSYQRNLFDILGPDIVNINGVHQNPLQNCIVSEEGLNKLILKTRIKLLLMPYLYQFKHKKNHVTSEDKYCSKCKADVPLHGSCLIFSKTFIKKNEYPFFPETFLYGEEDILYYLSMKNQVKMIYDPQLKVKHIEDATSKSISNNNKEKRIFELKNSLQSLLILKKIMKKG